jgi:acetoin utilization deacetylase AcuC-like enzyme
MTVPILADSTWTCGYHHYFNDIALPFVQTPGEWEPDLVIVCAGYDGLLSDELASVSLTASDYGTMTGKLLEHLSWNRDIRPGVVLGLEGGYQLQKGAAGGSLADAVLATVQALLDEAR